MSARHALSRILVHRGDGPLVEADHVQDLVAVEVPDEGSGRHFLSWQLSVQPLPRRACRVTSSGADPVVGVAETRTDGSIMPSSHPSSQPHPEQDSTARVPRASTPLRRPRPRLEPTLTILRRRVARVRLRPHPRGTPPRIGRSRGRGNLGDDVPHRRAEQTLRGFLARRLASHAQATDLTGDRREAATPAFATS